MPIPTNVSQHHGTGLDAGRAVRRDQPVHEKCSVNVKKDGEAMKTTNADGHHENVNQFVGYDDKGNALKATRSHQNHAKQSCCIVVAKQAKKHPHPRHEKQAI